MKKLLLTCLSLAFSSVIAYSVHAQTIAAHRGLFLQPGYEDAENTLAALKNAYNNGYTAVELDVRTTSDGVAVLMHDNAVNPANDNNVNFAGFSPQRTTNWDGSSGTYTPVANGAFSIINSAPPENTPLNPSYANMQSNVSYFKIYNSSGSIIGQQEPENFQYGWDLEDALEHLNDQPDYADVTIVLDIQSVEALNAATAAINEAAPINPIVFKIWTTALSLNASGKAVAWLSTSPNNPAYRNLVVSDNGLERNPDNLSNAFVNDNNSQVLFSSINQTDNTNLKGFEYFLTGKSTLDAPVISDIQNASSSLQKWGVLRLYDFTVAQGDTIQGSSKWQCGGSYLIGSDGLCYFTANTGIIKVTPFNKLSSALNFLQQYPFNYIVQDVYAPGN